MKVFVEFGAAEDALRALKALKGLGYLHIATHAPFPLTEEEADAPLGSLALGLFGFGGGLVALAAAYLVQWYANVWSYPLNIGGRPAHAGPAFVPASFESVCLVATLAVFAGFLLLERLPRLWQPAFDIDGFERATVDRFWLVLDVEGTSGVIDRTTADIVPLEPLRIVVGEDG